MGRHEGFLRTGGYVASESLNRCGVVGADVDDLPRVRAVCRYETMAHKNTAVIITTSKALLVSMVYSS